jgi:hypothetical protein
MAKVTGFNRKRIGHRNYVAAFDAPPTSYDEYGQVQYTSSGWTTVVSDWYCEVIDAGGGEVVDGYQTRTTTVKVLAGDPVQIAGIDTTYRCRIDGVTYGIVAIRDVSGDNRTKRVELKGIK